MDTNLQLKSPSENNVSVLSINNVEPSTNRSLLKIYRTPVDPAIKKLKKLEG
tara:strand:- start:372 stop:527 length:156 start_codon:yes stop_codon:yes gene_type:complete